MSSHARPGEDTVQIGPLPARGRAARHRPPPAAAPEPAWDEDGITVLALLVLAGLLLILLGVVL